MKCLCCLILLATSVAGFFTDDVYKGLVDNNRYRNIISSPLSVEIVLSMVYLGTSGKTDEELRLALSLPEDKVEVGQRYKDIQVSLYLREKDAIIDLANSIYINNQYTLNPEFNHIAKKFFNSEAQLISTENPANAASTVNKWVNQTTHGRIKDIVTAEDMDSNFVAVLLNAIYFKGQWQYKFDAEDTDEEDFQLLNGDITSVQMMGQTGTFRVGYVKALDADVIQLPYRNSSLSMVIFLPKKVDGLLDFANDMLSTNYHQNFKKQTVVLKLPKFKIDFKAELNKVLKDLRIRKAFEYSDDFGGLVKGAQVRIEKVLQKAFIEVNEAGAEAAVVTAINIFNRCAKCGGPPPFFFAADHPFAFVIRDDKTVYFQGQFTTPTN